MRKKNIGGIGLLKGRRGPLKKTRLPPVLCFPITLLPMSTLIPPRLNPSRTWAFQSVPAGVLVWEWLVFFAGSVNRCIEVTKTVNQLVTAGLFRRCPEKNENSRSWRFIIFFFGVIIKISLSVISLNRKSSIFRFPESSESNLLEAMFKNCIAENCCGKAIPSSYRLFDWYLCFY